MDRRRSVGLEYSTVLVFHDGLLSITNVGNNFSRTLPYTFDGSIMRAFEDINIWGIVERHQMEIHWWGGSNTILKKVDVDEAARFLERIKG